MLLNVFDIVLMLDNVVIRVEKEAFFRADRTTLRISTLKVYWTTDGGIVSAGCEGI
jgi:hypothetical protein